MQRNVADVNTASLDNPRRDAVAHTRLTVLLATNANTVMTVMIIVPIIVGWVALAALWFFVFRGKKEGD